MLFVLDVKCDTEEGDLLCGKYTVRTRNVQHICRYCHCPTADADNPKANYKMKKQKDIEKLVRRGDLAALKRISQQNIKNAWYKVRFHAANEMGIHGACPSEMLHAILLGIFKYLRGIFFDDMGDSSKLAEDMNGLAQMYGKLLTHQSDTDLPYTNFAKGIQKGKLMAKQYRGVLLVMAALLRSTLGRKLLKAKKIFGKENGLRDWTLLVELLLEWEAFLCENRMKRSHVTKLAQKHRYIMYIIQNVAKRAKGMGLKIMKFHAITHLVQDILLYGVPSEFDTGSNESHHKATKTAAKMTQRKEETFDHQTAPALCLANTAAVKPSATTDTTISPAPYPLSSIATPLPLPLSSYPVSNSSPCSNSGSVPLSQFRLAAPVDLLPPPSVLPSGSRLNPSPQIRQWSLSTPPALTC